jgi:hypothetical protein
MPARIGRTMLEKQPERAKSIDSKSARNLVTLRQQEKPIDSLGCVFGLGRWQRQARCGQRGK